MTTTDGATVFVIDDDDLVRAAIQGMLKSVGLKAETFGRPQEFLSRERPDGPSCLILDVELPGMSVSISKRSWRPPASAFPSSSSPDMEIFR